MPVISRKRLIRRAEADYSQALRRSFQFAFLSPIATKRTVPAWAIAAGVAILFLGIVGYAKSAGHWNGDIPAQVYRQLVPHANEVEHPGE